MSLTRVACAVAMLAAADGRLRANVETAPANVETNPYATIVDRNPFALKPPPPPPPPPEQTAPPVPMAKVTLTGLLSSFGEPRVLLEIVEDGGKGGTPKKPILREGERMGPVEVLAIDVVKNTVRLRNSGVETNITFEVAKSSGPVAGGPGVPGNPPALTPPVLSKPVVPGMNPQTAQAPGPTVVSPGGVDPGASGVTLMGNNPTTPGAAADAGMRTIPSRPLRTENMTKEQADLLMEVNRLRGGAPAPPTFQGGQTADQGVQQPNPNPAYPKVPYPRAAPPVPGRQ